MIDIYQFYLQGSALSRTWNNIGSSNSENESDDDETDDILNTSESVEEIWGVGSWY